MKETDKFREAVIRKIAGDKPLRKLKGVTYEIDGVAVHAKVKSGNLVKYPFNINNAVLAADYEAYICGSDELYYLVPVSIIEKMYSDPSAMQDRSHAGLTIVDVHPENDRIVYGKGGKWLSITEYKNGVL